MNPIGKITKSQREEALGNLEFIDSKAKEEKTPGLGDSLSRFSSAISELGFISNSHRESIRHIQQSTLKWENLLKDLENSGSQMSRNLKSYVDHLDATKSKNAKLTNELKSLLIERDKLTQSTQILEKKATSQSQQIESLQEQIIASTSTIEKLRHEMNELQKSWTTQQSQRETEYKAIIEQAEKSKIQLQEELEQKLSKAQEQKEVLISQIVDYKKSLGTMEVKLKELTDQLNQARTHMTHFQSKEETLIGVQNLWKESFEALKAEFANQKLLHRQDFENYSRELQEEKERNEDQAQQLRETRRQEARAKEAYAKLESQAASLRGANEAIEDELKGLRAQLSTTTDRLNKQTAALTEELQAEREQAKRFEKRVIKQSEELLSYEAFIEQQDKEKHQIQSKLQNALSQQSKLLTEIEELKNQVQKSTSLFKESTVDPSETERIKNENIKLNQKLQKLSSTTERLNQKLEEAQARYDELRIQVNKNENGDEALKAELAAITQQRDLLQTEKTAMLSEKQTLINEKEALRAQLQELSYQSNKIENELKQHTYMLEATLKSQAALKNESLLQLEEAHSQRLREQTVDMERNFSNHITALEDEFKQREAHLEKVLEEREAHLEMQLEELTNELENTRKLVSDSTSERESLRLKEERMTHYWRSVDRQKNEVRNHVLQLSKELSGFKSMNPLKQYLKITEQEIARLQVSLAKMPAFADERARLEHELENLVKQQSALKAQLEASDREIDLRAKSLVKLAQSEDLIPSPPPPPDPTLA